MNTVEPVRVDATEIRAGDLLVFGRDVHRITRIEPYTGFLTETLGDSVRVAIAEEAGYPWKITLIPGERLEVIR